MAASRLLLALATAGALSGAAADVTQTRTDLLRTRDVCSDAVEAVCPCDLIQYYAGRCLVFGEHMNASYAGDVDALTFRADYGPDCMDFHAVCDLHHAVHDEQRLEYRLKFDPCDRKVTVGTRFVFGKNLDSNDTEKVVQKTQFSTLVTLKEGSPGIVLSAPDHIMGTTKQESGSIIHYTEYLTVYFKDHWRDVGKIDAPLYKKSLHVKLETRYDDTSIATPAPTWRQLSYDPLLQECGDCYGAGALGCLGSTTALFMACTILFAITLIGYTILISAYVNMGGVSYGP